MVVHHNIGSSPPHIHLGVFSIRNGDQKGISEASAAITGVAHCHDCVTARKTNMEPEKTVLLEINTSRTVVIPFCVHPETNQDGAAEIL